MRLSKMIDRFKIPSLQIPVVESLSSKLARWRSTVKQPMPRTNKILSNMPAIFSKVKLPSFKLPKLPVFAYPKLPKINIPKFELPKFPGLGLKFKIPKIGFPKFKLPGMPRFPDIGGLFQGKIEDVTNLFQGIFEKVGGVAEDWQAKRERTKTIRNIIIGLILLFIAALLWKRK